MEIIELKKLAKRYNLYLTGDASLFTDVNAMDKKTIASLKKEYADSVNKGRPVQLFRFVLLNLIEQGVTITQESFAQIKSKLEKRDIDDYNFLSAEAKANFKAYPKKQKSFFVNWKNPATIFFPFLYTQEIATQVEKEVENILDTIIKSLKLTNVKKHIVDFNGPQNYGSGRCWGSIYTADRPSHKDAYQLHFTLGSNGFEGALYAGSNMPRDLAIDERETISTQEELIKFLETKKEKWQELSNQTKETSTLPAKTEQFRIPLNQIFYGPPGTGKTYHTISEAVKIVEELSDVDFKNRYDNNRADLKKVYEQYVLKGQIAFITFHQSLGYEDFIEGIKPLTSKQSNGDTHVTYEVKSGIFKSLCENAEGYLSTKKNLLEANEDKFTKDDLEKAIFYKMSLGRASVQDDVAIYEYCIRNNKIALGWGDDVDYSKVTDETILKELAEQKGVEKKAIPFLKHFRLYMKPGNYVIVTKGNDRIRAIAKIKGDYEFNDKTSISYSHFRDVEWVVKDVDISSTELYDGNIDQKSLYPLDRSLIKLGFFDQLKTYRDTSVDFVRKNFVLIIDEINRGNVSQIFGELITLLEEDKRKGSKEELLATLPYSLKPFGVPNNLFLIGTMNTADKSVEALDSALRRRFFFRQMLPDIDTLSPEFVLYKFWDQYSESNEEEYTKREKQLYEFVGLSVDYERDDKLWEAYDGDNNAEDIETYFTANKLSLTGINLKKLLNAINFRIEKLLNVDYTIGHAYFINIYHAESPLEALKQTFSKNILPLLQEYFYGDYGKIGLVLGEAFVAAKKDKTLKFASFKDMDQNTREDYEGRTVYELTSSESWSKDDFIKIYA